VLIFKLCIPFVVKEKDQSGNWCHIGTKKSIAPDGAAHYVAHMSTNSKSALGKRGRPAGVATKRINARFPAGLAEKIEYAASLRGLAVAAFIQEAVAERADRVIEAESRWQMTREEAANLAAMIAKPPKPNQTMLNAAKLAARDVVIRS
jgi:uncharacterized protein (DUF1778 family)